MFALFLALLLGQKFYADDPILRDNDSNVAVTEITKRKLNDQYDFIQHSFGKPGDRSKAPAANANTLGNVPDSSWFQNRHGMFPMSVAALAQGPNNGDGPSFEQPWVVVQAKTEGITPGFRIRDARGDQYVIKFDPPENPELSTAAEVISTKFFHAIGYNVPENYITSFTKEQLQLDGKSKLSQAGLEKLLKRIHRGADGKFRAVASKILSGTPVGPFQYFGTRPDDPNDIFPHENRRELRGLRVFSAWLNHDDSRAINTLDMLVNDEGRQHVRHYLIDFGSTMGSGSTSVQKARAGWEYMWEPKATFGRIATLGLWDQAWIRAKYPKHPSIGNFESKYFDPEKWKPEYPNSAFSNMTDQDAYWAARIVMGFTEEEIRAIVKTGQFTDPDAEDYMVATLVERRNKIGRAWLTRVSSFDDFQWTPAGRLQFKHLASYYDIARRPEPQISWFSFDNATGAWQPIGEAAALEHEGYVVAVIASAEGRVEVFSRIHDRNPQIVGVERQ
jgi:hypothetical protein